MENESAKITSAPELSETGQSISSPIKEGDDVKKMTDDAVGLFQRHKPTIAKVGIKIGWKVFTVVFIALCGYIAYMHSTISDMKTKQDMMRVELSKEIQSEFIKQKESFWREQKQRIDGLKLFTDAYECHATLRTNNGAKRYRESIRLFREYSRSSDFNDIPNVLRRPIYAEAVRALSIQGEYDFLTELELEEITKSLNDEMAISLTQFYVACIYLGKGQFEKARSTCRLGMNTIQEALSLSCSIYVCAPDANVDLAEYYALMVLIDLASPRNRTQAERINDCWAVLTDCEQRQIVHPSDISLRFDRSALLALVKQLKLGQPVIFADTLLLMRRELEKYYYHYDYDAVDPELLRANGIASVKVIREMIPNLKAQEAQPKATPKTMPKAQDK